MKKVIICEVCKKKARVSSEADFIRKVRAHQKICHPELKDIYGLSINYLIPDHTQQKLFPAN